MEERERSPLPRDAFSFAFFLSSLLSLSLSLFPKTRATQSQRRRPFCRLLSAFSFFFQKFESSLAVARAFKFFHQRSKARRREEDEIQKKRKKERKKGEEHGSKRNVSLSLFWWCLAAQKTPIDASAARVSLPSSSSSSSSSPFPSLSR